MTDVAKISVSLPRSDMETLDALVSEYKFQTRSQGVRAAIRALQRESLARAYDSCFSDPTWKAEAEQWDVVSGDGLADAQG